MSRPHCLCVPVRAVTTTQVVSDGGELQEVLAFVRRAANVSLINTQVSACALAWAADPSCWIRAPPGQRARTAAPSGRGTVQTHRLPLAHDAIATAWPQRTARHGTASLTFPLFCCCYNTQALLTTLRTGNLTASKAAYVKMRPEYEQARTRDALLLFALHPPAPAVTTALGN